MKEKIAKIFCEASQKRTLKKTIALIAVTILIGCSKKQELGEVSEPPFVRTVALSPANQSRLSLTGTIQAQNESQLSVQVSGRILKKLVNAGQTVKKGQVLFELDPRDLLEGVNAALADLSAAEAALATAQADMSRSRMMSEKQFMSSQAFERAQLVMRESAARRDSAAARLVQARNSLSYGQLIAPADGVLIDVMGEPGQVVSPGQPLAQLAQSSEREVEVFFPETFSPPQSGFLILNDRDSIPLRLREIAGALDSLGRTRRARYTITTESDTLVLGRVVRTVFDGKESINSEFLIPLGALNERGQGPMVWRFKDGVVDSVPVKVNAITQEFAIIQGELQTGDKVVAVGTHLMLPNMKARELAQ